MAGAQHLMRKAAIEKLASPEQLDMTLRVTKPVSWLAILTIAVMLSGGIAWAFLGTVYERVDGQGVWLRGDVDAIKVTQNGRVGEILVGIGDRIQEGQEVARIELPDLANRVQEGRQRLDDAENSLRQEQGRSGQRLGLLNQSLSDLDADIARQKELLASGTIRKAQVDRLESRRGNLSSQLGDERAQLARLRSRLEGQRQDFELLEGQYLSNSVLRSAVDGQVAAVNLAEGALIRAGQSLIDLQDTGGERRAFLYVSSADAAKVVAPPSGEVGQEVQLSPTQFKREEWGYIVGRVEGVSSLRVTEEELEERFENLLLAQKILRVMETPKEVIVVPEMMDGSERVRWSSGRGPGEVDVNSYCTAQIVVNARPPWQHLIFKLRGMVGLG